MIVLGVSGGHDANWCMVRDGVILGAFEKERFTRRRHDSGEILSYIHGGVTITRSFQRGGCDGNMFCG